MNIDTSVAEIETSISQTNYKPQTIQVRSHITIFALNNTTWALTSSKFTSPDAHKDREKPCQSYTTQVRSCASWLQPCQLPNPCFPTQRRFVLVLRGFNPCQLPNLCFLHNAVLSIKAFVPTKSSVT